MPSALEAMAQHLVRSGRLRVNADLERNFVKYSTPDNDRAFSARELTDPALIPETKATIAKSVPMGLGPMAVNDVLDRLRNDLKKARGIHPDKELRVARMLVQSAHPAAIAALLHERTEIFVSYAHTVGDLMAVHFWQNHGQSSGLQSTCDNGTAVYVSCGGDPFFDGDPAHKTYTTDGFPALARMLVIAGQEIGHFADLKRHAAHGLIVGRHSAEGDYLRPSPACKAARDADMRRIATIQAQLAKAGLARLRAAEEAASFYDAKIKWSPLWYWHEARSLVLAAWFKARLPKALDALYMRTLPKQRVGEFYARLLADMAFNLAPDAAVYKRANPLEEEAIACIEALARVPQQVNKWGHAAVEACWPELYVFYYGTVIPSLSASLPEGWRAQVQKVKSFDIFQQLKVELRRLFTGRPPYLR